jgi:hypothetical protein
MPFESPKIFSFPSLTTTKEERAKMDTLSGELANAPEIDRLVSAARTIADKMAARMAPKGSLGLPKLLDERRLRYGIPDAAFTEHAVYDRVLLFQIDPKHMEEKNRRIAEGAKEILYSENMQKVERLEAPRGVIVSAGLLALDAIRSNGMDLGHIVSFGRLAPWAKVVDEELGHVSKLMILSAGDIVSSEDLHEGLKNRTVRVKYDEEQHIHVYIDENGKEWRPAMPAIDPSA